MSIYSAALRLVLMFLIILPNGGCIELLQAIYGVVPDENGGGIPPDGLPPPDGGSDGPVPTVTLRVSNSNPTVGEEVFLACRPDPGDAVVTEFRFQTDSNRLIVNMTLGLARFIVAESDLGTEISVTCTATNDNGTSGPSNRVVILATP